MTQIPYLFQTNLKLSMIALFDCQGLRLQVYITIIQLDCFWLFYIMFINYLKNSYNIFIISIPFPQLLPDPFQLFYNPTSCSFHHWISCWNSDLVFHTRREFVTFYIMLMTVCSSLWSCLKETGYLGTVSFITWK